MTTIAQEGITRENFEQIVKAYEPMVRTYLDVHLRYHHQASPEDIEDALILIWFNAWRSHATFHYDERVGEDPLKGWLLQITMNATRDILRVSKRLAYYYPLSLDSVIENEDGSTAGENLLLIDEHTPSLEEQVITRDGIRRVFARLQADERLLLWEAYAIGHGKGAQLPQIVSQVVGSTISEVEAHRVLANAKRHFRKVYKRLES